MKGKMKKAVGCRLKVEQPKLLPCPLCGAPARAKQYPSEIEIPEGFWLVKCSHFTSRHYRAGTGCPVGPGANGTTLAEAAAKWNNRAPVSAAPLREISPLQDGISTPNPDERRFEVGKWWRNVGGVSYRITRNDDAALMLESDAGATMRVTRSRLDTAWACEGIAAPEGGPSAPQAEESMDHASSAQEWPFSIHVRLGEPCVATVLVGAKTFRASCTESGLAACTALASKVAADVKADSAVVQNYNETFQDHRATARLVLTFKRAEGGEA